MVPRPSRSSHDWVRSYLDITFCETDAAPTHAQDACETQEAENASQAATLLPSYLTGLLAHCLKKKLFDHTARLQGDYVSQNIIVAHQMQGNFTTSLDSVYLGHATVDSNSGFSKRNKENEQDRDNWQDQQVIGKKQPSVLWRTQL